jgi:hypothetical protein
LIFLDEEQPKGVQALPEPALSDLVGAGPPALRRVGRVLTYRKASSIALLFPPALALLLSRDWRAA